MSSKKTSSLVFALLLLFGCSPASETHSETDQERARQTLITALDAWKSGNLSALTTAAPPIRLNDDDLLSGLQLKDYEVLEPDTPIQPFQDVAVKLILESSQGESVTKTATYQVGLKPVLSVLRSDN